jgi:hypothetical protein
MGRNFIIKGVLILFFLSLLPSGNMVSNPEGRVTRADGTYTSSIPLHLPADTARGTYVVKSEIQRDNAKDSREFTFAVI